MSGSVTQREKLVPSHNRLEAYFHVIWRLYPAGGLPYIHCGIYSSEQNVSLHVAQFSVYSVASSLTVNLHMTSLGFTISPLVRERTELTNKRADI